MKYHTFNGVKLNWKNILYPHAWVGDIGNMQKYAKTLGYHLFAWNGWIYNTVDLSKTNIKVEEVE